MRIAAFNNQQAGGSALAKSATARPSNTDQMFAFVPHIIKPVRVRSTSRLRSVAGSIIKVTYRYADAGNWKFWGEFFVLGELSIAELQPHLFDQEFFIPERIGLPSLVPKIRNEDDHLLHTFEEVATVAAARYECFARELIERVRLANEEGWFAGIS